MCGSDLGILIDPNRKGEIKAQQELGHLAFVIVSFGGIGDVTMA